MVNVIPRHVYQRERSTGVDWIEHLTRKSLLLSGVEVTSIV